MGGVHRHQCISKMWLTIFNGLIHLRPCVPVICTFPYLLGKVYLILIGITEIASIVCVWGLPASLHLLVTQVSAYCYFCSVLLQMWFLSVFCAIKLLMYVVLNQKWIKSLNCWEKNLWWHTNYWRVVEVENCNKIFHDAVVKKMIDIVKLLILHTIKVTFTTESQTNKVEQISSYTIFSDKKSKQLVINSGK